MRDVGPTLARTDVSTSGFLSLETDAHLESLLARPETIRDACYAAYRHADSRIVDLGQAYGGLSFMLRRCAPARDQSLDFILDGGREIQHQHECGIMFPRAFMATDVAFLARRLDDVGHDALITAFDGALMDRLQVRPFSGWSDVQPSREELGFFLGVFDDIKRLVQRGSREGFGMLAWLEH